MQRIAIKPENLLVRPHHLFDKITFLLTCGDFATNDFNTMTIGWGSIGTMWNRPFVMVAVRPTRYTYEFFERYQDFTVSAFPSEFRKDLTYLGTHSGRDGNKLKQTRLTPIASAKVKSPGFEQAELVIECKNIYYSDFDPAHFLDPKIDLNYPAKDYHRVFYGEIVNILGTEEYRSS
jgi:flavin reductase (DIM6/NTAB) family NADH-FMN oxidoreductase RutF